MKRFFTVIIVCVMVMSCLCSCSDKPVSLEKENAHNKHTSQVFEEKSEEKSEENTLTDSADSQNYNIVHIEPFSDGLALIHTDVGSGYMAVNGHVKIAPSYVDEGYPIPVYEEASSFSNGLARVKIDGKYGYINTEGELVIDAVYQSADEKFDILAFVKKDGISQYINAKGEAVYISTGKEVKIGEFCNGFFWVETVEELISGNVNTITYYNEKGETAFSIKAENAGDFSSFTDQGYAIVKIMPPDGQYNTDKDYKMIDRNGEIAEWVFDGVESDYTTLRPYSQNYYFYTSYYDGSYGAYCYIDFENKKVYKAPTIYNKHLGKDYYYNSTGFEYDESLFQTAGNIILRDEKIILRLYNIPEFGGANILEVDYCSYNDKDYFWVYLNNSSGVEFVSLIDIKGNVIIAPTKNIKPYANINYEIVHFTYDTNTGLCKARDAENDLFGFIDMSGNWVIQPQYRDVSDFYGEGDNAVAVADHNTIINSKGDIIFTIVSEDEE